MVLFSPESWHHHNTLHEESKPKNARRERGWVLLSDLSKTERHWGSALQALWELGVREEINLGQSQITLPSRGSCCQVRFVYFLFISLMTFLFYFILFLNFTILYSFCQISKWIRHRYTCVPHPEPSSLLPPHTLPLGHPSAPAQSIQYRASNLDWRLVSYMILYMFQCYSPKSPHLLITDDILQIANFPSHFPGVIEATSYFHCPVSRCI